MFGNSLLCSLMTPLIAVSMTIAQQPVDLLQRLMPNRNPNAIQDIAPDQRDQVIDQLQAIQKQAAGERLLEVAFLLAAYGVDYEKNRDAIVHNLQGCTTVSYRSSAPFKYGCNDRVEDYLSALYKRGHKDVLQPMLLYGRDASSAMVQEGAGSEGAEVLVQSPTDFLDAIQSLPRKTQRDICGFVGADDGGGMNPQSLRKVRVGLKAIGSEAAMSCLREVESANKRQ
jgi:hypothetical protein